MRMNDYMSALYSDLPYAQPNEWSQMLMSMANQNNSWSAEQALKQMEFQREMSNTAHQREIADLKAAGLNPVLSAKLGGASTPSGSAATADTSIVSSMVQLMDKMLDVQGTSAAAAYKATGGSNVSYGTGDITSFPTSAQGVKEFLNDWNTEKAQGAFASIINLIPNKILSKDQKKEIINDANKVIDGGIIGKANSDPNSIEAKIVNGFNNMLNSAKEVGKTVVNFGKWLTTGSETSKSVYSKIGSSGSNSSKKVYGKGIVKNK